VVLKAAQAEMLNNVMHFLISTSACYDTGEKRFFIPRIMDSNRVNCLVIILIAMVFVGAIKTICDYPKNKHLCDVTFIKTRGP